MSISNQKGDIGEAAFVLASARKGYWTGKMPQDCPYDFVLDRKDGFMSRIQVKYRSMNSTGTILIKLVQKHHSNRQTYTADNIDYFAVYVSDIDKVFLVPVRDLEGVDEVTLRCVPTKNKQNKTVRMIDTYEQW